MKDNPFDNYANRYEAWFEENAIIFQSELLALKEFIPHDKKGIEIGIGSGIFADKLNINFGIDPALEMLKYAKKRNIAVVKGIAESLPFSDCSFDFAVFITSICFIDSPQRALAEAHRILKKKGSLIIAFIDRLSKLGKSLEQKKGSKFYKQARFYSVDEVRSIINENFFEVNEIKQTLLRTNPKAIETPIKGYGDGSFVVIKGNKI